MKEEKDALRDIAEIRSMMERSSKFLSLSGGTGALAGVYALAGAYIVHQLLGFAPKAITDIAAQTNTGALLLVAVLVLFLAIATAVYFSLQKATRNGEPFFTPAAKQLVMQMAVPLVAGGLFALIALDKGWVGLLAPITQIFYGIALFMAGKYTYAEVKSLGLLQILLGLLGLYWIPSALIFWAIGFGVLHIIYGIYMHIRHK